MLTATIMPSGRLYGQNSSEPQRKYCFDSVEVMTLRKIAFERNWLRDTVIPQYKILDSINNIRNFKDELIINESEKQKAQLQAYINELKARQPIIINQSKWYKDIGFMAGGAIITYLIMTLIRK